MKRRLLILKTGCAPAAIREARGDFEHWFTRGIDHPVQVHDATTMPPALDDFSGLLITGSPAMVSHRNPGPRPCCPGSATRSVGYPFWAFASVTS